MTSALRHALLAVTKLTDSREVWHAVRAGGVTASEIHSIANGGRGTWKRIRAAKLAGAGFRGNAHTARGHEREPFLLQWANDFVAECTPSNLVFAHPDHLRHMATPDGFGFGATVRDSFGVEVKSHEHNWDVDTIPHEHMDQMQLGMWVTGFDRWLYVWEVMGEDGRPTLDDPQFRWVERDDARIARLVREADAYLAWSDAGAPDHDDLPDVLDDALAEYALGLRYGRDAEALKKPSKAILATHADRTGDDVVKLAGTRAAMVRSVETVDVLDADAWEEGDAETYAEYELAVQIAADAKDEADRLIADAIARGFKTTSRKESMRVTANKEPKAA